MLVYSLQIWRQWIEYQLGSHAITCDYMFRMGRRRDKRKCLTLDISSERNSRGEVDDERYRHRLCGSHTTLLHIRHSAATLCLYSQPSGLPEPDLGAEFAYATPR